MSAASAAVGGVRGGAQPSVSSTDYSFYPPSFLSPAQNQWTNERSTSGRETPNSLDSPPYEAMVLTPAG